MDTEETSLITDRHRAMIGVKTPPSRQFLKAVDVLHVRNVLEDHDPRYADGTGIAAPYALSVLEPRPTADLPADMVPRILPTGVLTQSEWTVHQPFKLDQELWASHEVMDLRERLGGRFGRSILLILRTEFRDGDGELVAETAHTITQYDPRGAEAKS
ncbi:hypothetical protein AYO38_03920 [bacterium SCGC AG-212-C10]|nr:hypothetical protein AYO38_03920 [bacterium SCGC AG-212-C10]